jgi:hypothetical protein
LRSASIAIDALPGVSASYLAAQDPERAHGAAAGYHQQGPGLGARDLQPGPGNPGPHEHRGGQREQRRAGHDRPGFRAEYGVAGFVGGGAVHSGAGGEPGAESGCADLWAGPAALSGRSGMNTCPTYPAAG